MKTLVAITSQHLIDQIFSESAYKKLKSVGEVVFVNKDSAFGEAELREIIGDFDFCITGWGSPKFTNEVLDEAKNLKLIGHAAGTVIPVVDRSVFSRGIKVVNANSYLAKSTAEFAVTLMLAGAWNINGYNQNMKKGIWSDVSSESVMGVGGQTIGLIGYGEISREVIRLLKPFNAKILLFSRHCTECEAKELGVTLCELDELLKASQIVSLHNTLTEESRGMLGKREFALMRKGTLLVNTARQPIIDNEALISEMGSGRLFGAFDVYEMEPIPAEHPLLGLPNVICAPHIGGFATKWKNKLAELVADNIIQFIEGEKLITEVDVGLFDRQSPR